MATAIMYGSIGSEGNGIQSSHLMENHSDPNENRRTHEEVKNEDKKLIKVLIPLEQSACDDSTADSQIDSEPDDVNIQSLYTEWYSYQQPEVNECPFKKLHHSGLPTEFLHYPLRRMNDTLNKNILAGMNDLSTGVSMKVRFIINNLKDCLGVWPQLFLQKLITIVVYADRDTVMQTLVKDDFSVMNELATYYAKERKCCLVFRYWCLLYNVFSRNLIQVLPTKTKSQLVSQLQIDFTLAAQNSCRCKLDSRCLCQCEPDDEHRKIGSIAQMKITAILMYYLVSKIGNHSTSACNIYQEKPPQFKVDNFVKESVVPLYIKLYESSNLTASGDGTKLSESNLMELLTHLIMAYNTLPLKNTESPTVLASATQLMLDIGYLSSAIVMKNSILSILQRECEAMRQGQGFRLLFIVPEPHIYFTTLGLSGIFKALSNLVAGVEYEMLLRDELSSIMYAILDMQKVLGQNVKWKSEYENIYLHSCQLQSVLEKRMGYHISEVQLQTEGFESAVKVMSPFRQTSESENDSSETSQSRLNPSKSSARGGSEDDWLPDVRSISKMRKGYENDLYPEKGKWSRLRRWVSQVCSTLLFSCGRMCGIEN